jgi:hypothetical protein
MQLRRIIGYLQKLLYTVNRIRMSPTPILNIYLFEGAILGRYYHCYLCNGCIEYIFIKCRY